MSSYHILNAIWIGIFPMLAVTVIIGIVCYFLCCINQFKIRYAESKQKKAYKKARQKLYKQQQKQLQNNKKLYVNDELVVEENLKDLDQKKINPNWQSELTIDVVEKSKLKLDLFNTPQNEYNHSDQKPNNEKASKNSEEEEPIKSVNAPTLQQETNKDQMVIKTNDFAIEQLVVQELKESPKSVYSRLQNLIRFGKAAYNSNSKKEKPMKKADSSNDLDSFYSSNDERNRFNNNESFEASKKFRNSFRNYDTQNDYDEKSTTSFSSINETIDKKEGSTYKERRCKKLNKALSSSQCVNKTKKKFFNFVNRSQSSSCTKNDMPDTKKPKLITINKNRLSSDIEVEDDLIFHDDNDSLSSTGICATATSQTTLANKLNSINRSTTKKLDENIHDTLDHSSPKPGTDSINDEHLIKAKLNPNLINSSSIEDIDPDENIVKNLLVKNSKNSNNNDTKNKRHREDDMNNSDSSAF